MASTRATRVTRRHWTLEERRERSLALADEHGLSAASCRFYDVELDAVSGELLALRVDVASESRRYDDGTPILYQVAYDAVTDSAQCNCEGAWWGAPCKHAGAAIRYGRMAADGYSPAGRAQAERAGRAQDRGEDAGEALGPSL